MEYLFLKRKETSSTSQRQKNLLFKAAEKHWEEEFVMRNRCNREVDSLIYKNLLYQLEIKKVFLNSGLSVYCLNSSMLSAMIEKMTFCSTRSLSVRASCLSLLRMAF